MTNTAITRLFDEFFAGPSALNPAVDIEETDSEYQLLFDLPGIVENDLSVEVQGHQIVVSGERRQVDRVGQKSQHRIERYYGSFQRSFSLPHNVDVPGIRAHYENGVLSVLIPKTKAAEPHKIPVQFSPKTDSRSVA